MQLSYGQIEGLIGQLNAIAPERRGAMRSRLKHFKRLGFPRGVNIGSGRRVAYGPDALLALATAFELLQLGMSPEKIVSAIDEINENLVEAAAHVGRFLAADHFTVNPDDYFFLLFDPNALANLSDGVDLSATQDPDHGWLSAPFFVFSCVGANFGAQFDRTRLAMINMTTLLFRLALYLKQLSILSPSEFGVALTSWALSSADQQT